MDLAAFGDTLIQISLVEGSMAVMLIALSMTGTERHRREERIGPLAARLDGNDFVILLQDVRGEQIEHLGGQLRMDFAHMARNGLATPDAVSLEHITATRP